MSRHQPLIIQKRRLPSQHVDNNPYQPTTIPASTSQQYQNYLNKNYNIETANAIKLYCSNRKSLPYQTTTIDIGYSDETSDTQTNYDYQTNNGFPHSPLNESDDDDDDSDRLPYYEFDDESTKRFSRNSEQYNCNNKKLKHYCNDIGAGRNCNSSNNGQCNRKIYPNHEIDHAWDAIYQEIPSPACETTSRRLPISRLSDRPQSSLSSGVTSAIVYGCGGKCQTFENICYFFLQLVFTMGILVGVSLCIAGLVLRKSAARNLQVLVYIGVLLSMVSALLLIIQCNARNQARKRLKMIKMSKRTAPIQMETLQHNQHRLNLQQSQQNALIIANETNIRRSVHLPQVHQSAPKPIMEQRFSTADDDVNEDSEEQGIPWWRRQDLNTR